MTNIRNFSSSLHPVTGLAEKITSATNPATPLLSSSQLQTLQALAAQLRTSTPDAASQAGTITLFTGPDKAAKYAAAQTLASNLNRDLYRIDLGALVSKYTGDTNNALAQIFQSYTISGAILFFDEADALFGKRTSVQDSHDKYANQSTDESDGGSNLLHILQQYSGIAILAVSSINGWNPALLARTHTTLKFPPNP